MLSASTPASVPASSFSNTSKQRTLVPEIGLHVLHTPSDNIAAADIVFVHGLQGSPYKTWTWKGEVAQKRRWPRFGLGRKDDRPEESERISPEIFWPADFLYEDYPDLRILTYGYDSHVSRFFNGPANKSNLSQLGEGLLNRLSGERSRSKASKRPIIFVAHSLGGLVVKEALVESKKYEDNAMKSDIYESIKGIVFFGTPHRGSSDAQWGDILRSIASVAFDTNEKLLQTLKPDNELLAKLAKDFQDILDKESLKICSLLESSGKTGLSIFHGKVVPDFSASFNSRKYEHLDYINNNHMNMCRFTGKEDDGYQSFRTGLEFCMGDLPVTEAREGLLQSLGFENMLAREAQLREASPLTLDWLWEISDGPASIQQWLSSGTGVFWIQGKPASGKSTLMNHLKSSSKTKSALAHARTKRWVVVRFFFDFRARTGISNNFDGLLRAILYQLASDVPELAPSILDFGVVDPLQPKGQKDISWSCSQLRAALLSITSTCESNILLLIDGVDELDGVGQDVLDMIELFQALNDLDEQRRRVKVCIASRPIPMMVTAFSNSPGFSLERYNYQGIKNYVECRMQIATRSLQASQLSPDFLYSFVEPVAERSLGVFLWARFAADELLEGFSNGDDRHEMWARLDTLPDELEAIYHRITTRTVHACGSSQETSVMLQIAYFTLRPLSIKEFYVLFHTSMRRRICYKSCSLASFERKLRAKTGGLLEVTSTKVKLIHETVRAYCDRLCGARGSFFTDHEKSWAAEKLQQSSRHGLQEEEVVGNGYWVTSNRNNTACSDSVSKSFPDRNEQANSLTSDLPYPTVLNTRRTPDGSSFEKGLLALLVPVIPSSTFLPPSTENQPPGASSNTGGKDSSVTLNTGGNLKTDPKPKRRKISTFNSETIATTSLIRKTTACIRCRTQRIRMLQTQEGLA
ncbi:hypothetical protein IFR05_003577 [Cadophora sp. M221]|nr:hypothetical protein IFR05_003577 [Cadophora sp. M221]